MERGGEPHVFNFALTGLERDPKFLFFEPHFGPISEPMLM